MQIVLAAWQPWAPGESDHDEGESVGIVSYCVSEYYSKRSNSSIGWRLMGRHRNLFLQVNLESNQLIFWESFCHIKEEISQK